MQEEFSDKWAVDFANMFKSLKTSEKVGSVIGEIVSISPLTIKIMDGEILINASEHEVYVSTHLLDDYKREMKGKGVIRFNDTDCGNTTEDGVDPHQHKIEKLSVNTNYNFEGEITHTDGLKVGDVVLLSTDETERTFYIISKLKKVGG